MTLRDHNRLDIGVRKLWGELPTPLVSPQAAPMDKNICIIGASLEERSFGLANETETNNQAFIEAMMTRLGFTGNIHPRAVSSTNFATGTVDMDAAKVEMDGLYGAKDTIYYVHQGGNNISSARPYEAADDAVFNPYLTDYFDTLSAGGSMVLMANASKRLYVSAPAVSALPAVDADGSLPYNENIYEPFMRTYNPQWYEDGAFILDNYDFWERNEDVIFVSADGIHPNTGAYGGYVGFVLGRIAAKLKGVKRDDLSGRKFVATFTQNTHNVSEGFGNGYNVVRICQENAADQGDFLATALEDTTGDPGYFLEFKGSGWRGINTAGAGTAGAVGITEVSLDVDYILSRSIYQDATTITSDMTWANMAPGLTGTITFAASRNAADVNRTTEVTVQGVTKTLNAATDAVTNEISFDFTVDSNGEVYATFDHTGSTWGYVSGVQIEFD